MKYLIVLGFLLTACGATVESPDKSVNSKGQYLGQIGHVNIYKLETNKETCYVSSAYKSGGIWCKVKE